MTDAKLVEMYEHFARVEAKKAERTRDRHRLYLRAISPPPHSVAEAKRRQSIQEAARKAREGEGVIYVAEVSGTDTIKIGYTVDTTKMVKRIASDYGVAVKVIGTMPATIMQEKSLHARLRKYRNPGPVRGCATEFYPRSVMLAAAFPLALIAAIEDASKVTNG